MPSELARSEPVALFLFAHQDDEFGIFQKIVDEQEVGNRVCCAYLTDGSFDKTLTQRRNQESLTVLGHLGVRQQDVFFAGEALGIADATLPEQLEKAAGWLRSWLGSFAHIRSIYVVAWEGGHHDHDALHALTVQLAHEASMLPRVRQFSLYNGYGCSGPLFRVMLPLALNGPVETTSMRWRDRIRFLRYCLGYPSQTKTWVGLFPFVLLHYVFNGEQAVQGVSLTRLGQRPHSGALYYERRGFSTWEKVREQLAALGLPPATIQAEVPASDCQK